MIMLMASLLVYTPELLAGTWVGCEDPFLRIYSGTSGGNEMAAPKWGIFMSKVYADKKLGYGKLTAFEKPAAMNNEELSADTDWVKFSGRGIVLLLMKAMAMQVILLPTQ